MFLRHKKLDLPKPEEALPGRDTAMRVAAVASPACKTAVDRTNMALAIAVGSERALGQYGRIMVTSPRSSRPFMPSAGHVSAGGCRTAVRNVGGTDAKHTWRLIDPTGASVLEVRGGARVMAG